MYWPFLTWRTERTFPKSACFLVLCAQSHKISTWKLIPLWLQTLPVCSATCSFINIKRPAKTWFMSWTKSHACKVFVNDCLIWGKRLCVSVSPLANASPNSASKIMSRDCCHPCASSMRPHFLREQGRWCSHMGVALWQMLLALLMGLSGLPPLFFLSLWKSGLPDISWWSRSCKNSLLPLGNATRITVVSSFAYYLALSVLFKKNTVFPFWVLLLKCIILH